MQLQNQRGCAQTAAETTLAVVKSVKAVKVLDLYLRPLLFKCHTDLLLENLGNKRAIFQIFVF